MALYDVEYSCGHKGQKEYKCVGGTLKNALEHCKERLCPDCLSEKLQKKQEARKQKIAAANSEAKKVSEEMGFPKLTGTKKQVAWANTIRLDILKRWQIYNAKEKVERPDTYHPYTMQAFENFLMTRKKASWWIDRRVSSIKMIMELWQEQTTSTLIERYF